MKFYAGIGSRKTPSNILNDMTELAKILDDKYVLRSGGADGADKAFELGASNKQIFLPWAGFNDNTSKYFIPNGPLTEEFLAENNLLELFSIAGRYHPVFASLRQTVKRLIARNTYQVLGPDLKTHSSFIICWMDPKNTGGTGQAIRIANDYGIKYFNLFNMSKQEILKELEKLEKTI